MFIHSNKCSPRCAVITFVADAGGTRIKLALMRDGGILGRESCPAPPHDGLAPQLPRIAQGLDSLCAAAKANRDECSAFAMAFPSLIDSRTGRVLAAYGKYVDAPRLDLPQWSRNTLRLPLIIE